MKLKSLILSFALTLFAVSGLLAQDKYEYATVIKYGTIITYTTADSEESFESKSKDVNKALLKKVNELNSEGWEIYNTTNSEQGGIVTYYLRKKKN